MKKRNVINLIRYHIENNNAAFHSEACEIARDFDASGDYELAEYVMSLISDANAFVPQTSENGSDYFTKLDPPTSSLPLPESIANDIKGICNAIAHNAGINRFLFQGPPGTGKTETARQIGRITNREVYGVDFSIVVDSRLGQTTKNIVEMFSEINRLPHPEKVVILFDEIDALALDRIDQHDVREMGRATSSFLKQLDSLNGDVVLIATTNLFKALDKALTRRFDATIDFGRYSRDDLVDIAESITNDLLSRFRSAGRDMRLLRKIINAMEEIPYPGDLRNLLRTAFAFSDPNEPYSYLRRLYVSTCNNPTLELSAMREQGFTIREVSTLTGIPRSTVSRELQGAADE